MNLFAFGWSSATGYRRGIASVVTFSLLVALVESVTLLMVFSFVTAMVSPRTAVASAGVLGLIGQFTALTLFKQGVFVLLAATLRYVLALRLEWQMSKLWVQMRTGMQVEMLKMHLEAAYSYLVSTKGGEHLYHIMQGPGFAAVFYFHLARYASSIILLCVLMLTLLSVSTVLILISLGIGLAYALIVRRVSMVVSLTAGQVQAAAIKAQTQSATEGLAGIRYLRVLGGEQAWLDDFAGEAVTAELAMRRTTFWTAVPPRTLEYLVILIFLGAVFFALFSGGDMFAAIPTFAVYFLAIVRVLPALSSLGNSRMQMMEALPNLQKFIELREVIPRENRAGGSTDIPDLRSVAVCFEQVTFGYGDENVLTNFSCEFAPGKLIAVVGKSGQGKSTAIDLILRFVDPRSGRITAGGKDIREFDLATWRRHCAYVGQDPFLFHNTVIDNIRFGRPDATDREVMEVAARAGALEFMEQLPQKWQTILADRGASLSGGQRQRLALARALLSHAEILLLDEPTSALDASSEALILETVVSLRGHRTVVLVTHREEVLKHADRILVLKDGAVTENGTYDELLRSGTAFGQIFNKPPATA